MIVKPTGAEQEDRLHAAVGSVVEAGAKVRTATRTAKRFGWNALVYYFFGVMMIGLMFSSTPIWFKAMLGMGMYMLFRWARKPKPRSEEMLELTAAEARQASGKP